MTPNEKLIRASTLDFIISDRYNQAARQEYREYLEDMMRWYWLRQLGIDIDEPDEPSDANDIMGRYFYSVLEERSR